LSSVPGRSFRSTNFGGAAGGTIGGVTVGQRQTARRQRRDLQVIGQRLMPRGYVSRTRTPIAFT
jgi:hypothetical protein